MTPFIPALLTKLTLILALGLLVTGTLRSFSPSLRHLILSAALACGVALPLATLLSPQWNVPVLPRSTASVFALPGASGITNAGRSASNPALNANVIDASATQSPGGGRDIVTLVPLLPLVWAIGFMAVMGWLAIGRIRLRRIAAASWPLDDSDWSKILGEERRYAGVSKPVLLFSSSVVSTPLTWGSRAPVVLLPEDALDWPEAHRRIVLRHELAHISRSDSFTQLVAGFVCALYWFHPLVWITERRLRAECERACDDSVVSLGTPAAEYAAHLLEVARSARAFGAPGFLSVAMARPSQLEGRLLAVLNQSRRRVSLSRRARPTAALLSALLLIPLAAFHPVPKPDDPTTAALTNSVSSELSAGATQERNRQHRADTTFQLSVPVRSGGTLTLDLKTGGGVVITGSDKPEVLVRASLGGRDWRDTEVSLQPSSTGAQLETRYSGHSNSQSTRHEFEIRVPRSFNVRISSSGGSVSIAGIDGTFTGNTGGGEINIRKANGKVDIRTGGGDVRVSDSRLSGTVSTGGGVVEIEGVTGNLSGYSGSGHVTYVRSSRGVTTTTTSISSGVGRASGYAASGVRMTSAGGPIILPAAPDGAHVTTGGGPIRIGPSGGEIYASTGGGPIDIGPATGSVEAHTGGGPVTIEMTGDGAHSVDVTSGKGQVVLNLPRLLDATLELETAYTDNLGHKTSIVSDWPLQITETDNWDRREGTSRRYVRARQTIGRGGSTIRVRTVNGNIVLHRNR